MSKKLNYLATDIGYGETKVVWSENGVISVFKNNDMITPMSKESEFKDNNEEYVEFSVDSYSSFMVGPSAKELARKPEELIYMDDYETFKKYSPIIIKKYLSKYVGRVDKLILTLSVAYKEKLADYLSHVINVLDIDPNMVSIRPQGRACFDAYKEFGTNRDRPNNLNNLSDYLFFDIGFNTIDVGQVINSKLLNDGMRGHPKTGVGKACEDLRKKVNEIVKEDLSISVVKEIFYEKSYTKRGQVFDLSKEVDEVIINYLNFLHEFTEKEYGAKMNSVKNVVLFGGGAELVRNYTGRWDSLHPDQKGFFKLMDKGSEFYNALGAYYWVKNKTESESK